LDRGFSKLKRPIRYSYRCYIQNAFTNMDLWRCSPLRVKTKIIGQRFYGFIIILTRNRRLGSINSMNVQVRIPFWALKQSFSETNSVGGFLRDFRVVFNTVPETYTGENPKNSRRINKYNLLPERNVNTVRARKSVRGQKEPRYTPRFALPDIVELKAALDAFTYQTYGYCLYLYRTRMT